MSFSPHKRSVRRLSASSLARRERRAAAKRRRKMLAAAGAFATVALAPLSITAWMGQAPAFPHLDAAKSFFSLMTGRSPGDRTAAELMKTKKAPHQRALAKIAKPENPPAFEEAIAPPPAPMLAELPPFTPVLAGLGPLLETPPPGGNGPPITTTDVPPGGGGGPPTETPPENPPPPVVPEPGTWATMLLGFGLVGWMMRRRRRTETAASWA